MRITTTVVIAAALGLAAGACDTADTEDGLDEGAALEQPADALGAEATGGVAEPGARLAVDTLDGVGPYLTDGTGRALYMIEGAPADSVTCYEDCATEWPPFLASAGAPRAAAPPVQAGLIGTIDRRDGQKQVTYAGHALYYYHEDTGPGMTTGQDVHDAWGEWYLVRPSGEHLEGGG